MKPFAICLLCLFVATGAFAQISGYVVETTGRPVSFATVALLRPVDSAIVNSATASDTGTFRMGGVKPGKYVLRLTAVGYQTYRSAVFEVTQGRQTDLGRIVMKQSGRQLNEVMIRASKPQVQQTALGVTVNVQNSIMTQGSSALDVLQRSPGVIIDQHNNTIALNGKTGVMVMIDGKLMRMSMDQMITLLSSMGADNIAQIELMNTPPAKYDAEGNAGIINIVTRKNKRRGTNGSATVTAGYGVYEKSSATLNINHNTGKVNLYGSYVYWHNHDYGYLHAVGSQNSAPVGGQSDFSYTGISKPVSSYNEGAVGVDITPDTATTIGASIDYWGGGSSNSLHNFGYYLFENGPTKTYNSLFDNSGHLANGMANLYLDKNMVGGQKLRADIDYLYYNTRSLSNSQSTFTDEQGNPVGGADSLYSPVQRDFGNTRINVLIGKLDYSRQINTKTKIEAGVKATYSRTKARSGIEDLENGVWTPNTVGSANNFVTYEKINAGYLTFNFQLDSATSLVAGARYEYSHNYTDKSADSNYRVDRRLGRLFPSIFFSHRINDHSSWQASYTERITRPSYNDLASYVSYNDPVSVFTGNPLLKPAITRNLKFGFNHHDYLFSILFSRDDHSILGIQSTTGPVIGVVYLRPENADWQNSITLQATIPVKITDWWDMNYTFTGGLKQYSISFTPQPFEKSYFSGSVNFSENFKLPYGLSAELSGYYNSASYSANWHAYNNAVLNLGLKKELGKGSLKIAVADIFRSGNYRSETGYLTTDAFNSKVHVVYNPESKYGTIVKLTYSRPFGSSAKSREKRDSGSGDERGRL